MSSWYGGRGGGGPCGAAARLRDVTPSVSQREYKVGALCHVSHPAGPRAAAARAALLAGCACLHVHGEHADGVVNVGEDVRLKPSAHRCRVSPPRPAPPRPAPPRPAPRAPRPAPRAPRRAWQQRPPPRCGAGAGGGTRRVRSVRGVGRGVSDQYGGWDEACPISTGGGTRRVRSVRGAGGGAGAGRVRGGRGGAPGRAGPALHGRRAARWGRGQLTRAGRDVSG